jgi:hypothetical protein
MANNVLEVPDLVPILVGDQSHYITVEQIFTLPLQSSGCPQTAVNLPNSVIFSRPHGVTLSSYITGHLWSPQEKHFFSNICLMVREVESREVKLPTGGTGTVTNCLLTTGPEVSIQLYSWKQSLADLVRDGQIHPKTVLIFFMFLPCYYYPFSLTLSDYPLEKCCRDCDGVIPNWIRSLPTQL